MRVLAGGPARETESAVFRAHRLGLVAQSGRILVDVRHEVVEPVGSDERWPHEAVRRVAASRQRFMDEVEGCRYVSRYPKPNYDGLLMVDSDIVMGPGVLDRLWSVDADVVYGVFWTVWPNFDMPMPQVWDRHPYGHTKEVFRSLLAGEDVEVFGGGACTLFRGRAFESRYYPLLKGLETEGWVGEDRTYCIGLEARGIKQVAVSGLPIVHLYHPDQQTDEAVAEALELVGLEV